MENIKSPYLIQEIFKFFPIPKRNLIIKGSKKFMSILSITKYDYIFPKEIAKEDPIALKIFFEKRIEKDPKNEDLYFSYLKYLQNLYNIKIPISINFYNGSIGNLNNEKLCEHFSENITIIFDLHFDKEIIKKLSSIKNYKYTGIEIFSEKTVDKSFVKNLSLNLIKRFSLINVNYLFENPLKNPNIELILQYMLNEKINNLEEISIEDNLTQEYLDLLISIIKNNVIKKFLLYNKKREEKCLLRDLIPSLNNANKISISSYNTLAEYLKDISSIAHNLKSLELNPKISDIKTCQVPQNLINLEELKIGTSNIEVIIKIISQNPNLRDITINLFYFKKVLDFNPLINQLKQLKKLRNLQFKGFNIKFSEDFGNQFKSSTIKSIQIQINGAFNFNLFMQNCPKLEKIDFYLRLKEYEKFQYNLNPYIQYKYISLVGFPFNSEVWEIIKNNKFSLAYIQLNFIFKKDDPINEVLEYKGFIYSRYNESR